MPQFMPGSWRRFAVDFDQDGKIDLCNNHADVIGSVANFLQAHGWVRQLATHYPVDAVDAGSAALDTLIAAGITPQFNPQQLAELGLTIPDTLDPQLKLALINLPNGDAPVAYVLGTQNFFTITRYNRSSFYAMTVIELAQAIRSSRENTR
jgi:membrane-bound lytic murein transglycosylase B